jgi:hypothetical protein
VTFVFSSIAFRDEDRWIYLSGIRRRRERETVFLHRSPALAAASFHPAAQPVLVCFCDPVSLSDTVRDHRAGLL